MDEKLLTCPITCQIFKNPVLASDGNFYEKTAIEDWLTKSKISPISRIPMTVNLHESYIFNDLLKSYLEQHPDKIKDQYVINLADMLKIICNKNSIKDNAYVKQLIDNATDLECLSGGGWQPMHYICRYSTPEMIKYIIDKGVKLDYILPDGWSPIHQICRNSTPEMIKYIIDKSVDLECVAPDGWKPIHLICRYSAPEMIKYIIDKGVDLECSNKNNWKPIHFICRYSTPEMIKYIIDKGVDLTSKTNDNCTVYSLIKMNNSSMMQYYNKKINPSIADPIIEKHDKLIDSPKCCIQ